MKMYERRWKVGQVVVIDDDLRHDPGHNRQVGIISHAEPTTYPVNSGYSDYYVVSYNAAIRKYDCCGFEERELRAVGGDISNLIDEYAFILSDRCWRNTDHTDFNNFMDRLKSIRKTYRKKVKRRML